MTARELQADRIAQLAADWYQAIRLALREERRQDARVASMAYLMCCAAHDSLMNNLDAN